MEGSARPTRVDTTTRVTDTVTTIMEDQRCGLVLPMRNGCIASIDGTRSYSLQQRSITSTLDETHNNRHNGSILSQRCSFVRDRWQGVQLGSRLGPRWQTLVGPRRQHALVSTAVCDGGVPVMQTLNVQTGNEFALITSWTSARHPTRTRCYERLLAYSMRANRAHLPYVLALEECRGPKFRSSRFNKCRRTQQPTGSKLHHYARF
jgi:hypothetical protein